MAQTVHFRPSQRTAFVRPSAIREILKVTQRPDVISFAGGLPAPEHFPAAELGACYERLLTKYGPSMFQYSVTEGIPELREWVAHRMRTTWGVSAASDDVMITGGSQQGIDLIAKFLLDPGDVVAIEAPSYLGALQAFDVYQVEYLTIATDELGLIPDALESALSSASILPKLLYVVPNFQNPTGVTLAQDRRETIVRICERYGVPIFEDDPYGELRFSGTDCKPLAAIESAAPIFYAGTGSKILAPGLRVAWLLIKSEEIRSTIVPLKQATDLHTGTLSQYLFTEYVADAEAFERHIQGIRHTYGLRQRTLVKALKSAFGTRMRFTTPEGGMFLWATIDGIEDTGALFKRASEFDVAFVPGEYFYVDRATKDMMRLSFSNTDESNINTGVERLKLALDSMT